MKLAVVTGATGFLGAHLVRNLLHSGYQVLAVVRPGSKNLNRLPVHANLRVEALALADYEQIASLWKGPAELFFHLAWEGARAPLRDDAVLQQKNRLAAEAAFRSAAQQGLSCFVGAGSQAEYGRFDGPSEEDYRTCPLTEYGRQKLACYKTLSALSTQYDVRFIWPRIFSLYGPGDFAGTLVMTSLRALRKEEPLALTECIQPWDFLYVQDAADALQLLGETPCPGGVYDLASGESKPLKDFVLEMRKAVGSFSELRFGAVPYGPAGAAGFAPKAQKIRRAIPWRPKVAFQEGIRQTISGLEGGNIG
jgi:UDP-glucose 4-epimerase